MAQHDLHAVAFPRLDEAQITTLGRCAGAVRRPGSACVAAPCICLPGARAKVHR